MNTIMADRLQEAMQRTEVKEMEEIAEEIGREAVQEAVAKIRPPALIDDDRQRLRHAALADAIEVVHRQRARLGRRVCSTHDGATVDKVFELLRSMAGADGGSDSDPAWQ